MSFNKHKIKIKNTTYTIHICNQIDEEMIDQLIEEYQEAIHDSNDIFPDYELIFSSLLVRTFTNFERITQSFQYNTEQFCKLIKPLNVLEDVLKLIPQKIIDATYIKLNAANVKLAENTYKKKRPIKTVPIKVYNETIDIEYDLEFREMYGKAMLTEFDMNIKEIMKQNGVVKQSEYEMLRGILMIFYFTDLSDKLLVPELDTNLDWASHLIDINIFSILLENIPDTIKEALKQYNKKYAAEVKEKTKKKREKQVKKAPAEDGRDINIGALKNIDELLDVYNIFRDKYNEWKEKEDFEKMVTIVSYLKKKQKSKK